VVYTSVILIMYFVGYIKKDEGTLDDRRRDGGTNFILRIKEREKRLPLHEHDDDDIKIKKNDINEAVTDSLYFSSAVPLRQ